MNVGEYMTTKVITIQPDTMAVVAMKTMRDNRIRRLPVLDRGKLIGLVTQDSLRNLGLKEEIAGANYRWLLVAKTKVSEIMVGGPKTVTPDTTLEECAALGQLLRIGTFPVVDDGRLVGIITTTDLFNILTQVLGFGQPGVRLHLIEGYKDRPPGEVTDIVCSHDVRIQSMCCVVAPATGRDDVILHLDIEDAGEIMAELEAKGYTVEARAH